MALNDQRVSYSGKALNLITPESIGWANVGVQGGGGIQYGTDSDGGGGYLRYFAPNGLMPFLSEQNGVLGYNSGSEDDSEFTILRDTSGNPITKKSIGLNIGNDQDYGFSSYQDAKNTYSSGYVPWNIDNVYEGLSNRQHFNLNALWGGTQYAQGRVTDWSHLDPTQYQANYIAANTRNELWNEYDKLAAEGKRPAKNPDEVALDFYVKNVGPNGNTFGYGPGANTALITEAVKHQFLNSPDVIQARGTTYQTPQAKMADIDAFGTAHQAGVPTWQTFEQQGYSSGFNLGSLIPMIIGGMALGPMAGAFGGGLAGNALAGALIGGTTAEIGGGDFLKGALTGGVGAGLTGGLSGISSEVAQALEVPKSVADAITKAAATAVRVGASGGDVEQAIIGSLVNSGVGGAVSGGLSDSGISPDIVKSITSIATPVISTAIQGGDVETALANSLLKNGVSLATNLLSDPNSRDVEAQAGGYYGGAAPTTIAPPVVAGNDLSPLQYADTSNVGGTRIDVAGSPFYQGMEGSETIQAPKGMRLATYDEANQGGIEATTLPDGTMAFMVPDESPPPTSTEAPVITPEVQENTQSPESLFVDEAINNIVNPPTEPPVGGQTQNFLPPLDAVNNTPDQSMLNDQISNLTALQQQEISDRIAQGESLEQAIANVQTGLTDQLTGVQTGLTNQFQTGLENLGSQFSNELTGVQQSFQTQFDQLSDAQKDQALALLSQGQSLESAISSVQAGLTEQIGDVRTGLTDKITGLESNFQAQFDQLNDAQKDQALALVSQGQSLESAIDSVKTELTGQLQTGINDLDTKINSYIQSGIDRDTATQLAIDDLSNDFTQSNEDINRQLTELGLNTNQAISDVRTGLTDQIGDVRTGLTEQIGDVRTGLTNQLTGVQESFQTQFDQLSDAQKDQALALLSQGKTLEQAISDVQTGLTEQFQTGINELDTKINSYIQSGIDRDTATQLAIDDLSEDVTKSNEDINRQLTELGLNTNQAISDVRTGLTEQIGDVRTGLTNQLTGVQESFQSQFDQLSDTQKDQALALLSQGKTLEQAISDVQTGLTEQFQTGINSLETNVNAYMQSGIDRDTALQLAIDDLSNDFTQSNEDINRQLSELGLDTGTQFEDVNTQINALQTNINAYMQSGLDRDTATRMAIDDLSEDVTQSNEDINRQLTELGLDTGTQFEEVGNQISNLGGTVSGLLGSVSGLGGTVSGLLGSVSNLGGTVSGLSQNVATGQAETQRQLEGINYQNTMEKLGKILAEPNQKYDSPLKSYLQPSFVNSGQAQPSQEKDYSQIIGELASVLGKRGYKVGGEVHAEHNPVEFIPGPEDRYYARHMKRGFAVNGPGTGQSDDIPTMLADGEYVIDADTVAALGDGSSKAGAEILDKFRENIRAHKRSAPTDKIPPKAKSPLEYLKMAQKPKGSKNG